MTTTESKQAWFKRPAEIKINNTDETEEGHIIGLASANLQPPFDTASVGEVKYQWYKAPEQSAINYSLGRFLEGIKTSKTVNALRVAYPEDSAWVLNNETRDTDCCFEVRTYIPADAVQYTWSAVRGAYLPVTPNAIKHSTDPLLNVDVETDENGNYVISKCPAARMINGEWTYIYNTFPDFEDGKKGNTILIEWYDAEDNKIGSETLSVEYTTIEKFTPISAFEAIATEGGRQHGFVASDEGLYQLEITRIRNAREISERSLEYRVTNAPQVPVFAKGIYEADVKLSAKELVEENKYFTIEMDKSIKYDSYEITWMLYRQDIAGYTGADIEIYKEVVNTRFSNFNPLDAKFDEVFANSNIKDRDGNYYALVRTKRNGVYSDPTVIPKYMFVVTGDEQPTVEE